MLKVVINGLYSGTKDERNFLLDDRPALPHRLQLESSRPGNHVIFEETMTLKTMHGLMREANRQRFAQVGKVGKVGTLSSLISTSSSIFLLSVVVISLRDTQCHCHQSQTQQRLLMKRSRPKLQSRSIDTSHFPIIHFLKSVTVHIPPTQANTLLNPSALQALRNAEIRDKNTTRLLQDVNARRKRPLPLPVFFRHRYRL